MRDLEDDITLAGGATPGRGNKDPKKGDEVVYRGHVGEVTDTRSGAAGKSVFVRFNRETHNLFVTDSWFPAEAVNVL